MRRRWILVMFAAVTACSPRQMAIDRMASALQQSTSVYEADNDPEFVRLAAPSTLKTVEMLLAQAPDNQQLLLTACSGFTEYSYAFLQVEAELKAPDPATALDLKNRAIRMYQRARRYCQHGLELRHRTATLAALGKDASGALAGTNVQDVPWLYWTAAAWGAELSIAPDAIARAPEFLIVRTLLNRAKALDESWSQGAIYEALIPFDGLPALLGGSPQRARADFDKAIALSHGTSVFAYVGLARVTSDPAEKTRLLQGALAIDPNASSGRRLTNLIAQRYARAMLSAARPQSPAGH